MKTKYQLQFDELIKEIHKLLKPYNFKKSGNNFYKDYSNFGQILNIQKSRWNTKDDIEFTINIGIFEPNFYQIYYNKQIPKFPKTADCIYTIRIGYLKSNYDFWYNLYDNYNKTKNEVTSDIKNYILPFFDNTNTSEKIFELIKNGNSSYISPFGKLIIFCKKEKFDLAKIEYNKLLKGSEIEFFKEKVIEIGKKYNLVNI